MVRSHFAKYFPVVLHVILGLIMLSLECVAQSDPAAGIQPFSTQVGGQFDSIDPATSNIMLTIPILTKNGKTPFEYKLVGNFRAFPNTWLGGAMWVMPGYNGSPLLGKAIAGGDRLSYSSLPTDCMNGAGSQTLLSNISVYDGIGTRHAFPDGFTVSYGDCGVILGWQATAVTIDGSGYTGIITTSNPPVITAYDRSGNKLTNNGMIDPDGVAISSAFNSATGRLEYTDTLGQVVLTAKAGAGANNSQSTGTPDLYTYTDKNGNPQTVTVNYTQYTQRTNFVCSGITDLSGVSRWFPTSVVLSDAGTFNISYEDTPGFPGNKTGRLAGITLPTGGSISFTYAGGTHNGVNCSGGSVPTLTRTINDGQAPVKTWTYVNTSTGVSGSSFTVTATDPVGNTITRNFYDNFETKRIVTDVNLGVLSTTLICYNGHNLSESDCLAPGQGATLGPIQQRDEYTYLGNSPPSLVETVFDYDSFNAFSYGNPIAVKRYDVGATFPPSSPSLISNTSVTYSNVNGVNCGAVSTNIHNLPCTITTTNSSGTKVREVIYARDLKGHATQTQTWVTGSTYLVSGATYNSNGTLASYTDVNNAVTNYFYNGTGGCNNLFVTSTNYPVSSLTTSQAWDCVGGVLTSSTDENAKVTNYGYVNQSGVADPYWRLLSTTDPIGNVTWNIFSPTSTVPMTQETSLVFNSGASTVDVRTTFDSLGRPAITQRRQSPTSSNYDTVSVLYDSLGRVRSVSQPCSKTVGLSCASTPATTTTYDAMNRPLVVTDGGGGTMTSSYSSTDVLMTRGPVPAGETAKVRQFEYDGLRRLKSVCEITTGTGSGTCAQTTNKTGYWTKYTYSAIGDLTTVTQNAQQTGTAQQVRTYTYDGLSRLTSENNPESGTIQYFYDTAPSSPGAACPTPFRGDLTKSYDARGKTLCYTYDGMHRLLQNFDSTAGTQARYYVYDSATVNGVNMSNAKARLAQAYTATCSTCTKSTDLGFKYSAVGDLTETYQSTPNSGGYYHPTADYWPNGSLKNLWISQIPSTAYGADGEGRMSTVTPTSGQVLVPSNPSYNVASQLTSVTYGSSDHDDFIFNNNNGQMTQYKFSMGTTPLTLKGDLIWNANGTLKTQQITDQIVTANSQTCNYGYDPLARLASANCGTPWSQTFTLDSFGNLSKSGSSSFAAGYVLANGSTNNRIQSLPGVTVAYDASGNLSSDGTHSYTWDGFGKPVTVDTVGVTYDALGRAVEQNRSGTFTQIVYSPTGAKFALMNGATLTKARLPLPGGGVAVYNASGLQYYEHADWLNTSRLATTPGRAKYFDGVYAPYGEDYGKSGTTNLSFTGQYQDTVSGLYDFLYREYPSVHGRWISPDPAGFAAVDPENPQSWNRYAYVINDPLAFVDPLGLLETTCESILSWCSDGCPFTDASCPGGRWAPPGAPIPQTPDDYFSSSDKERDAALKGYAKMIQSIFNKNSKNSENPFRDGDYDGDGYTDENPRYFQLLKLLKLINYSLPSFKRTAASGSKPASNLLTVPQVFTALNPSFPDASGMLSSFLTSGSSVTNSVLSPSICLVAPVIQPLQWLQPGRDALNCGNRVLALTLPYLLLK